MTEREREREYLLPCLVRWYRATLATYHWRVETELAPATPDTH